MRSGRVLVAAAGWHDESPGGANRLPTDFARYLAGRGYHVTYLCASAYVDHVATTVIDGVELRRYASPTAPSPSVRNVREHWRRSSDIARAVAAGAPIDAVLGHSPLQYLSAAWATKGTRRRCYGVHSPFVAELRDGVVGSPSRKQRVAWRAAWHVEARVLTISDLVHCDSDYTRGVMAAEHPGAVSGKMVVLPGWVDAERFRPPSVSKDALRVCLGSPWRPGVPTFFSLRRLVPRMGLDTLVEASAILARGGRTFRVVIGGDGPGRASLEALASARGVADRVAFVGQIPESQLPNSYAAADCFVLPTRALECFGLIVLEAYACGVPVVGVPVGAIPEVMGEAFAGWIADDNLAPALARRMDDVLQGRLGAQPEELRRRARQFDMGVVMGQHERVLLGHGAVD